MFTRKLGQSFYFRDRSRIRIIALGASATSTSRKYLVDVGRRGAKIGEERHKTSPRSDSDNKHAKQKTARTADPELSRLESCDRRRNAAENGLTEFGAPLFPSSDSLFRLGFSPASRRSALLRPPSPGLGGAVCTRFLRFGGSLTFCSIKARAFIGRRSSLSLAPVPTPPTAHAP